LPSNPVTGEAAGTACARSFEAAVTVDPIVETVLPAVIKTGVSTLPPPPGEGPDGAVPPPGAGGEGATSTGAGGGAATTTAAGAGVVAETTWAIGAPPAEPAVTPDG
jgi:hypothetical protein